MSTAKFDTLSNLAGTQSVPVATVAQGVSRAWVNFNGTGTVAIRAAFNVSSITDNGTGSYRVNFTNSMTDTNYSAVFGNGEAASLPTNRLISGGNFNTNYVEMTTYSTGNAAQDVSFVGVAIFR